MIECIFTIDYEIFGNGEGSLKELVYEPTEKLMNLFDKADAKMVVFVEALELKKIEALKTDPAINNVKHQIKELYKRGHEIALHLHPQWCNAICHSEKWELDYSDYNLCVLEEDRIVEIVDQSIQYLKSILEIPEFTPLAFRAGNWLFQPSVTLAKVLATRGIKIDSSVFKGGVQHQHKLDYRKAPKGKYYWRFSDDVVLADKSGCLLEVPIYTQMVPIWRMFTTKRIGLQHKGSFSSQNKNSKLFRLLDLARIFHPKKFDFCRMTKDELTNMLECLMKKDHHEPLDFKPIVAIGHTKDLLDYETVEFVLSYLKKRRIPISTFHDVYQRCK